MSIWYKNEWLDDYYAIYFCISGTHYVLIDHILSHKINLNKVKIMQTYNICFLITKELN